VLNGGTLQATTASTLIRVGAGSAGANTTATLNSVIADDNVAGGTQLVKTDAGTLILGATNTYRGGTAVTSGTLKVSADTNLGAASGGITLDGGTLQYGAGFATGRVLALGAGGGGVDTQAHNATLNGVVTGTGALTKLGAGTLTLTGSNNYGGGTTVSGGTLQGNTTSLQGNIANNATVTFDQSASGTYAGAMTGSGSLVKLNAGTLTLTNALNNYSGGTTVTGGTLQGTTDTLKGNIANNANVTFDQASGGTYAGAMTGIGTLTKAGAGVLTLTNALNSYTGGTIINAGAVQGSGDALKGNIINNARLVFDQTGDSSFAGAISGIGNVSKSGVGSLNLTGISSFTGTTSINTGMLVVNGSIANSPVTVNAGGVLGGSGTVGRTTVASGGALARSGPIGTLAVNGSLTFMPGSVYRVRTDAAGNADRVNVVGASGTATINGGTVDVRAGSGTYRASTKYTILQAPGGVTGTFVDVTSDLAFLTPTLEYDAADVFLILKRNDIKYASVGITPNQVAVGTALDSTVRGAQDGALTLLTAVNSLSAPQAQSAFNQLGGEVHASVRTAMIEDSRFVREAGMDCLRQAHGSASPGDMGGCEQRNDRTAWVRLFGASGHIDGDGNASRLNRDAAGVFVGTDTTLASGWRMGGLVGYSRANLNIDGLNSSARTDSYHAGVYGGTQWGATNLRLGGSYTWNKLDTQRSVGFSDFADRPQAQYSASTTQVFAELGQKLDMKSVALEPFVGLTYVTINTQGFRESDGPAALHSSGGSTHSTFGTLGLRASTSLSEALRLRGMLGVRHAFGDNVPTSTHAFGTGSSFTVGGAPLAKNVAVVEVGVQTQMKSNTTLSASYTGQFRTGLKDQGIRVALGWKF